ncbi:MAG: acyl carrier protein [Gammaproteobacteria bacterium]
MQTQINRFITQELLEEEEPIEADENLLSDGMVDSLGMLRLIGFIDETFNIAIPPEDFIVDHFKSLDQLMIYLEKRKEESGLGS